MRYLGSILGSAGMAALLTGNGPSDSHFHLLFGLLVLAALAAVWSAARLPGRTATGPVAEAASSASVTRS
jgi:MYXO-CTERM domain-containing protein